MSPLGLQLGLTLFIVGLGVGMLGAKYWDKTVTAIGNALFVTGTIVTVASCSPPASLYFSNWRNIVGLFAGLGLVLYGHMALGFLVQFYCVVTLIRDNWASFVDCCGRRPILGIPVRFILAIRRYIVRRWGSGAPGDRLPV